MDRQIHLQQLLNRILQLILDNFSNVERWQNHIKMSVVGEDTQSNAEPQVPEAILHIEIDTRRPEWCTNPVQIIEIARAVQVHHRDDYLKSIARCTAAYLVFLN